MCLATGLSRCLARHLTICPRICPFVWLSCWSLFVSPGLYLEVCLPGDLSAYLGSYGQGCGPPVMLLAGLGVFLAGCSPMGALHAPLIV